LHTVRAIAAIPANKEILISYITNTQSRKFRQEQLLMWKFICNCYVCADDSSATEEVFAELQLIDAKIVHIRSFQVDKLQALIGLFLQRLDKEKSLQCLAWDTVVRYEDCSPPLANVFWFQ
jgi:hypothetical protein